MGPHSTTPTKEKKNQRVALQNQIGGAMDGFMELDSQEHVRAAESIVKESAIKNSGGLELFSGKDAVKTAESILFGTTKGVKEVGGVAKDLIFGDILGIGGEHKSQGHSEGGHSSEHGPASGEHGKNALASGQTELTGFQDEAHSAIRAAQEIINEAARASQEKVMSMAERLGINVMDAAHEKNSHIERVTQEDLNHLSISDVIGASLRAQRLQKREAVEEFGGGHGGAGGVMKKGQIQIDSEAATSGKGVTNKTG